MKRQVVIVAGGSGKRMKSQLPKQFLPLAGKPILMHTIERFAEYDPKIEIVVVLPAEQIEFWKQLCDNQHFATPHKTVAGGSERFFSVKNGLKQCDSNAIIAIHDGVRPFVSNETLERCFATAEQLGNAIPCIEVVDSLRKISDSTEKNCMVPRSNFRIIQTPQVFRAEVILPAFEQKFSPDFTDDASVAEAAGHTIKLVEGNRENIKITTEFDLKIAESMQN